MADMTDVYIRNEFTYDVSVIRKLWNGSSDLELIISSGDEEKILLPGTDTSLIIYAPSGVDIKFGYLKARTDIDMLVSFSRTDSSWEINIKPNSLPPETPTTVNITLGGDAP